MCMAVRNEGCTFVNIDARLAIGATDAARADGARIHAIGLCARYRECRACTSSNTDAISRGRTTGILQAHREHAGVDSSTLRERQPGHEQRRECQERFHNAPLC